MDKLTLNTKTCTKCNVEKAISAFGINRRRKDGVATTCKECNNAATLAFKKANKEKVKFGNAKYRKENKAKVTAYNLEWVAKNNDKVRAIRRKSVNKLNATVKGKLDNRMRSAIYQVLQADKAGRSWESLVGYTIQDLKQHIESKFTTGMTWDKLLDGEIHLDHIIAKNFFEYTSTDDQEFKYCWSMDNLQPLWASDNLSKHDTIPWVNGDPRNT